MVSFLCSKLICDSSVTLREAQALPRSTRCDLQGVTFGHIPAFILVTLVLIWPSPPPSPLSSHNDLGASPADAACLTSASCHCLFLCSIGTHASDWSENWCFRPSLRQGLPMPAALDGTMDSVLAPEETPAPSRCQRPIVGGPTPTAVCTHLPELLEGDRLCVACRHTGPLHVATADTASQVTKHSQRSHSRWHDGRPVGNNAHIACPTTTPRHIFRRKPLTRPDIP